jgi:hypothetical protein
LCGIGPLKSTGTGYRSVRVFTDSEALVSLFRICNVCRFDLSYAVLRSRSIFVRLRLQLVKNFGSGSDHFLHIFSKKIKNFHGFKKISCFLKPKMIIKRFFKVKSYEQFFLLNFKFCMKNLGLFCNILYEFTYPEPGLKTLAPAPQHWSYVEECFLCRRGNLAGRGGER